MSLVPRFGLFQKQTTYTVLSCVTACICFYVFVLLLFFPYRFLADVGVATSESAFFLARRASMLMLGFSVLSFYGRKVRNSVARQGIVLSVCVSMAGLASMGLREYWRGFTNAGILNAVAVEVILATAYLLLWLAGRAEAASLSKQHAGAPGSAREA